MAPVTGIRTAVRKLADRPARRPFAVDALAAVCCVLITGPIMILVSHQEQADLRPAGAISALSSVLVLCHGRQRGRRPPPAWRSSPLQVTLGYSPVQTGLAFLPMIAGLVVSAQISTNATGPRFGPRVLVPAGMLLASAGLVWLSGIGAHSS
ncbi:hypothetical protein [Streptomyces sp. NPDC005244]|uniref:hypothetical protein n=1 Tax=Streptomyces sp. NPDC005244 TaxID=3364708 RepID=UPI00369414D0